MIKKTKKHVPVTTWGAGYYILNIYHNEFVESEKAEEYIKSQKFALLIKSPKPHICIVLSHSQKELIIDSQIIIMTISPERKAKLGTPLDTQILTDRETAIDALATDNPDYIIDETELIKCKETIADLIEQFGNGYRLEFLGCCVEAI